MALGCVGSEAHGSGSGPALLFLSSLCLSGFVCRMGIKSTSLLRGSGVSGPHPGQVTPRCCALLLSGCAPLRVLLLPPDSQPLGTEWKFGKIPLVGPPPPPSPSCCHRGRGHCWAGSGDRAPWHLFPKDFFLLLPEVGASHGHPDLPHGGLPARGQGFDKPALTGAEKERDTMMKKVPSRQ